jgi:hypothetical protein
MSFILTALGVELTVTGGFHRHMGITVVDEHRGDVEKILETLKKVVGKV